MDSIKKILGTLFTFLGLMGLGISLFQYISIAPETLNIRMMYGVAALAFVLFITGVNLAAKRGDEI